MTEITLNSPQQEVMVAPLEPQRVASQVRVRTLAITSGKGGVGKTILTVNLAIEMARAGLRVTVFDADLGLANIHILMGMRPEYTLMEVIHGEKRLRDVIAETPFGVQIVAGGNGILELSKLSSEKQHALIDSFSELSDSADVLLVDTGAGISPNVMNFLRAADQIIIVTSTDITSMMDAYGVIKSIQEANGSSDIALITNLIRASKQAHIVYEKINSIAERFLDFTIKDYGFVYEDKLAVQSVQRRTPFVISHPRSRLSICVHDIAQHVIRGESKPRRGSFLSRLLGLFR